MKTVYKDSFLKRKSKMVSTRKNQKNSENELDEGVTEASLRRRQDAVQEGREVIADRKWKKN